MSHHRKPIIPTVAHATLSHILREVAQGAGLALVKGPVGVGKSFALDAISGELEADGVTVIRVTSTPAIEGSIAAFVKELLGEHAHQSPSTLDGLDTVWRILAAHPFGPFPSRAVLIVDEAQGLNPSVMEMLRGLYDRGDRARLGDPAAPAFGLVLVGNSTFLGKGGNQRVASFRPLLSRVTHNIVLPGPAKTEYRDMAMQLFPDTADAGLRAILTAFGEERGNLRVMAIAARQFQGRKSADLTPAEADTLMRSIIRTMGADIYAIRILIARETLDPFGNGVAAVCVRLPAYLKEMAQAFRDELAKEGIVSSALDALLADLEQNAEVATEVGEMIATLIGAATPERVGSFDVKPEVMQ
jgi:type II secretory pathway predicted ATPase ExeA